MLNEAIQFAVVNLYWLSLPLIGYAILHFSSQLRSMPLSVHATLQRVMREHALVIFFVSLIIFCILAAPIIFIFYITSAPVKLAVFGYVTALLVSLFYLAYIFSRSMFRVTQWDPFLLSGQQNIIKYTFILLGLVFAGDFLLAAYLRSYALFDVDTYYHMTRVLSMVAEGHFSIASGYFTGVPDSSYHANFIYSLYVIPARMFNYQPLVIWEYSFGFFRLIQWLAIFTLGYNIFQRWLPRAVAAFWASLATIVAIPLYSYFYFIAPYPNQVVIVWIIAFIIALIAYVDKPGHARLTSLLLVAFLITATHPTYALMTAIFLTFWYVTHLLMYKRRHTLNYIRKTWSLFFVLVVLMVGPLITKLMPSHITQEQIHLGTSATINFLFMSIEYPQRILPQNLYQWVGLLLSVVGFFYILRKLKWRQRPEASVLIALASFTIVVYFVPPIFTILKMILPIWVIERFATMNVLQFILPFTGIALLVAFIMKAVRQKVKMISVKDDRLVNLGMISAVVIVAVSIGLYTYGQLIYTKDWNRYAYGYSDTIRDKLSGVIPKNARILADNRVSYGLPAVIPVNVIAVGVGHSTMAADTEHRTDCQKEMFHSFRYQDLIHTGVDYVVVSQWDSDTNRIKEVSSKPYLQFVTAADDMLVYKFDKNYNTQSSGVQNKGNVYSACVQYGEIES